MRALRISKYDTYASKYVYLELRQSIGDTFEEPGQINNREERKGTIQRQKHGESGNGRSRSADPVGSLGSAVGWTFFPNETQLRNVLSG